jgi:hypothetical protein
MVSSHKFGFILSRSASNSDLWKEKSCGKKKLVFKVYFQPESIASQVPQED